MEAVFVYLLKASALIMVFYLAYHFLVRKETFFNSNRWFLLSGLLTSALLPLFVIKKVILVERPKVSAEDLVAYSQVSTQTIQDIPVVEAFDWMQFIWVSYIIIASVLVIRIVFNFTSLYRMLYQQQVIKKERFKLVNLNENIAPFSFFNYIVYNSDLYSNEELQSILMHEKIHSQERHSLDVLVAKIFCIAFWFNPFVWFYKKAITQNLEYIADQKAIEQLEDKKSYQRALLKVVSHQSCLSITNNFYQSLIKKRIVMLNKNQSHKRNSWKYAVIIPALIGFIVLFQIKVVAQQKEEAIITKNSKSDEEIRVVVNKNTTDAEMKKDAALLKEKHGVTLKYSKVKRNSSGEITGIKLEFKDKNGNKGVSQVDGNEPIKPIHFYKNDASVGFGSPRQMKVYANINSEENEGEPMTISIGDSVEIANNMDFDFNFDFDALEAPEPPEAPEVPEVPVWSDTETKIVIKKDDKKPLVILNGKVVEGDESILSKKEIEELLEKSNKSGQSYSYSYSSNGNKPQIFINGKNMLKINRDAMAGARLQMEKARSDIRAQRQSMSDEQVKMKVEMEKARANIKWAEKDLRIDAVKAEMEAAKVEMQKAKVEMEAAKAEFERAKAEFKNKK